MVIAVPVPVQVFKLVTAGHDPVHRPLVARLSTSRVLVLKIRVVARVVVRVMARVGGGHKTAQVVGEGRGVAGEEQGGQGVRQEDLVVAAAVRESGDWKGRRRWRRHHRQAAPTFRQRRWGAIAPPPAPPPPAPPPEDLGGHRGRTHQLPARRALRHLVLRLRI